VDGKDLGASDNKVAPLTNFLGSMFQQCDIFLNDKCITSSNNMYAHRAYLEQLLNYSPGTASNQLTSNLFYQDTEDKFDMGAGNKGFEQRRAHIANGNLAEMRGPLFVDICNQNVYLVNNVDVRIRLTRAANTFCLMATDADAKAPTTVGGNDGRLAKQYSVHIEQAVLWMNKITLNATTHIALEQVLRRGQNALYNIQRVDMKSFTIAAGETNFTREHINLGLSPKYAIIGLVSTEAMQGSYKRNPFNFQHFNLKQISLNIDGEQTPRGGINCDYDRGIFLEAYESLVETVGKWKSDNTFAISRDQYAKGFTLYGFQIAPELVEGAFNLVRNTNIRLDLIFDKALTENITVLVWFAYDSVLEIDKNRDIYYDFSA
jgi:hypothetical protein